METGELCTVILSKKANAAFTEGLVRRFQSEESRLMHRLLRYGLVVVQALLKDGGLDVAADGQLVEHIQVEELRLPGATRIMDLAERRLAASRLVERFVNAAGFPRAKELSRNSVVRRMPIEYALLIECAEVGLRIGRELPNMVCYLIEVGNMADAVQHTKRVILANGVPLEFGDSLL